MGVENTLPELQRLVNLTAARDPWRNDTLGQVCGEASREWDDLGQDVERKGLMYFDKGIQPASSTTHNSPALPTVETCNLLFAQLLRLSKWNSTTSTEHLPPKT